MPEKPVRGPGSLRTATATPRHAHHPWLFEAEFDSGSWLHLPAGGLSRAGIPTHIQHDPWAFRQGVVG